ncbi:MAG: type II toxin-antitoxin system antitoxin SocA domain-containing protein [Leptospirales bacterium]
MSTTAKLDDLIHTLSVEHKIISGKCLFKTSLFKYIDLFEFEILKETGHPPLNLEYLAWEKGPVPVNLNSLIVNGEYDNDNVDLEIIEGNTSEQIKFIPNNADYNLDNFSEYEIEKIYDLIDRFATNYRRNTDLINATHELKSWKKAWHERRPANKLSEKMYISDEIEHSNEIIKEHFEAVSL